MNGATEAGSAAGPLSRPVALPGQSTAAAELDSRPSLPARPTWIEIDHQALANNVAELRACIGPACLLMGVVKANAYGHGVVPVAHTLLQAGTDRFGVATLAEAMELRSAGFTAPILVLGYTPAWQAATAVTAQVTLTVFEAETATACAQAAAAAKTRAQVHLKVNTGMNRLGVSLGEALPLLQRLAALPHLQVEGIFTHFSSADLPAQQETLAQLARFSALLHRLEVTGLRPPIAHAANSAAALTIPGSHLQMVRCGISLYGLHPSDPETRLPATFQPVLSWKSQVAQVRTLEPGDTVGYGQSYVATQAGTMAVIPVGYADGFPRAPCHWQSVLIHGRCAPIIGRVSMDQTAVEVTAIAAVEPVRQGDEVVLIGSQQTASLSAEEVGRRLGTINYEVVSRILGRVPRIHIPATADRSL